MFASAAFNLVVYSFTLASLFCLSCFSYDSARDFFFLASVCLFTSACAFLMNAVNSLFLASCEAFRAFTCYDAATTF